MRIAVIGASGWLGGAITREALSRGHEVTAIGRDRVRLESVGATAVARADVTDSEAIAEAVRGHDAVVSAVVDRASENWDVIPRAATTLLEALPRAGVTRLLFIGGAGSLEDESGTRLLDKPDFVPEYVPEALAGAEALAIFRSSSGEVEWSYLSPSPMLIPGEKNGNYRVRGGDTVFTDERGESRIAAGDLASAALDELEQNRFTRQRFTVGY
ncbi:MAG: NAD(P)H-binding protein [Gaiellaceae bacterium]